MRIDKIFGNGKRDNPPFSVRPRKIKVITFESFLKIKKILNKFKQPRILKKQRSNKKQSSILKIPTNDVQKNIYSYEPSNISFAYDSLFWRWRRVIAWHNYINDPVENINGHIIT